MAMLMDLDGVPLVPEVQEESNMEEGVGGQSSVAPEAGKRLETEAPGGSCGTGNDGIVWLLLLLSGYCCCLVFVVIWFLLLLSGCCLVIVVVWLLLKLQLYTGMEKGKYADEPSDELVDKVFAKMWEFGNAYTVSNSVK